MKNSKGLIYNFLRSQRHMTLSAPGVDGSPEGITVNYIVERDHLYAYINSEDYSKYPSKLDDVELAGVLSADQKTLQLVAQCTSLSDKTVQSIRAKIEAIDPNARYYFTDSTRFYLIKPSILRYQDYSKRPVENAYYETSGIL